MNPTLLEELLGNPIYTISETNKMRGWKVFERFYRLLLPKGHNNNGTQPLKPVLMPKWKKTDCKP
jgi:hypothetical protein